MPLTSTLKPVGQVVTEGGASAANATSERFLVKANMNYWVDVDYSHPTRARKLLLAGETIDIDDQATIDILMRAPEVSYIGNTPP